MIMEKIHKSVLHFCDLQENELAIDCLTGGRSHDLTFHKWFYVTIRQQKQTD